MKNQICRSTKMMAAVAALLLIAACAHAPMKAYQGPELPASQTAVVESGFYTRIAAVDGHKVRALSVALLPGEHTIVMMPYEQNEAAYQGQPYPDWMFYSPVTAAVPFTAQAGHAYIANVDIQSQPSPGYENYSAWSWVGYIQDKTTATRLASTERLPLGAYPVGTPRGGGIGAFSAFR